MSSSEKQDNRKTTSNRRNTIPKSISKILKRSTLETLAQNKTTAILLKYFFNTDKKVIEILWLE